MTNDKTAELDEVRAIAMAAFGLSVNSLRFLMQKGTFDQDDVNAVVSGVLSALERSPEVSEQAVHSARVLLSGVAQKLEVPLKQQN